jgi:hypothetical protein
VFVARLLSSALIAGSSRAGVGTIGAVTEGASTAGLAAMVAGVHVGWWVCAVVKEELLE